MEIHDEHAGEGATDLLRVASEWQTVQASGGRNPPVPEQHWLPLDKCP
jgi:hypothetical protein